MAGVLADRKFLIQHAVVFNQGQGRERIDSDSTVQCFKYGNDRRLRDVVCMQRVSLFSLIRFSDNRNDWSFMITSSQKSFGPDRNL